MEEINNLIDSYIESVRNAYNNRIITYSEAEEYLNFNF